MKYEPITYTKLYDRYCFSQLGSWEILIKHSDAVAFDLMGNEVILEPSAKVFPKTLTTENYKMLYKHIRNHDEAVKATVRKVTEVLNNETLTKSSSTGVA